uniref:Tetraspanin n=1 Tax=Palpitomonas bilix TaxID=652834 RepID=A0A7S3G402_9EUKA
MCTLANSTVKMGEKKGCDCGAKFCRFLLILVNVLCMVGGIALIGAGVAVKVIVDNGNANISTALKTCDFRDGVNTQGFANCFAFFCDRVGETTCSALRSFPLAFVILGVFIFALAFLGCLSGVKRNSFCIIIYFFLLLVIFLGQFIIAIVAFFFSDDILRAINGTWNLLSTSRREAVMTVFDCCGFLSTNQGPASWCNSTGVQSDITCYEMVKSIVSSHLVIVAAVVSTVASCMQGWELMTYKFTLSMRR